MKESTKLILHTLIERYPSLETIAEEILAAYIILESAYRENHKLLICGNGGSAADSLHMVGELMNRFSIHRPLPQAFIDRLGKISPDADYITHNIQSTFEAVSLVGSPAFETAFSNDHNAAELSFAQLVYGYGHPGDILIAISTSGNSANVLYACDVAHAKEMKVVALTGESGGQLASRCDALVAVPVKGAYLVQELHLPVYHAWCMALENEFYGV